MLVSTNLWSEAEFTNRARGTVRYILYKSEKKPPAIPQAVVVRFPQYWGPSFLESECQCLPITPITKTWTDKKKTCMMIM